MKKVQRVEDKGDNVEGGVNNKYVSIIIDPETLIIKTGRI